MAQFESLVAANKARSAVLVAVFILLYTGLFFAIFFSVIVLLWGWEARHDTRLMLAFLLASHAIAVALAILCYLGGPGMVLSSSSAEPLFRAQDQVVHHIVEELALAAGCPTPAVYMIDTPAMNAMIAGLGPDRATLVVTSGLRDRLDRDQLQAVLAHEIARIQSYDVRLMTVVAAMVGLIILAAAALRAMVAEALDAGSPWFLAGVPLLLPALVPAVLLAEPCARLIQLAVSRERAFLADASAVRLTRYPEALAQALEILGADTESLLSANGATAHLFVVAPVLADGRRAGGDGVWSSHPEVEDRLARIRSIGNIEDSCAVQPRE
jgi:heat shock protein HtpX